jgi:exodeoxyribonuclease VII small subunit
MGNTAPESRVPRAASGGGGGRLRRPGADAGEGRAGPSFEQALEELETIVERLERGQTGLEEALRLWQRGEELHRLCLARLDAAQGQVEELARRAQ